VSASSLCFPVGVAVDTHGNVYVADESDNRVLEYNTPLTSGTTADLVFGQGGNFTSDVCNNGGLSASSLCGPDGVAVDAIGNVYVAEFNNNRVLEYNTPLTSDTIADSVFGQGGSFSSGNANNGGLSANSLWQPQGVAVDASGNLYIADLNNNRVLEYNSPLSNTTANTVFGQGGSFSSNSCSPSSTASNLCSPAGVAVDSSNNLYTAEFGNNRVLKFNIPLTTDTFADVALGQLDFVHNGENLIDRRGFNSPASVAIDASTVPNRLYVSDTLNNSMRRSAAPAPRRWPHRAPARSRCHSRRPYWERSQGR
jgi:NHL repeat